MMHDGGGIPADFEKDPAAAAASAATTSAQSYTKVIKMVPVVGKTYKFWFTYLYEDPETKQVTESANSPIFSTSFTIPNETLPVENLVLTSGIKSYGVKFDLNPASKHTDIIIFESLTGAFTGEEYIVYTGTSTSVTVQVDSFAPRWVKVTTRDKWMDINRSSVTAGPVNILANDPDTSTPPKAPIGVSVSGTIDAEDKSGFSIKMDVSWTASTDSNTNGYVIRWSANDPSTTLNPLWEYGQVDGRATNKFSITGLTPNTVYYWQVTAKSPFNAISWDKSVTGQVASGQFGPIADPNAPAGNIQLRSIISIGGKTADLFKIGTGITQNINLTTTPSETPAMTNGTYNGIILDRSTTNAGHNFWLSTGQFRVGSSSSFLFWDGSNIYTTGKINATGGSFTGDVQLNGGTLYTGPTPLSGARVRFDSAGLFGYNATSTSNTTGQTFALTAADGKIDARLGYIGGWTIQGTAQTVGTISKNGTILGSDGSIVLGDTTGTLASIVKLSSTDPTYRIWVGSQLASNAKFKVDVDGVVYANGAVISGDASFSGTLTVGVKYSDGTTLEAVKTKANNSITSTDLQPLTTRVTNAESSITAKASSQSVTDLAAAVALKASAQTVADLTSVVGLKAAKAFVDDQLALKASLIALDAKLNANAYTILDVAAKINAIDTSVVTINGGKITAGSVDAVQIAAGAITAVKIATGTITANEIETGTITADQIAVETITALEIASGAITADKIVAGTITAAKIAATQTFTGHTIVGSRIASSSSNTRVELVDNTLDSLRALISGTTVGHVFGYGSSSTGGMVMMAGSTANADTTSGHVRVLPNYATLAGDSTTYVEANGNSNIVNVMGTSIQINAGSSGVTFSSSSTSDRGDVYFPKTSTSVGAQATTTGSNANAFLNTSSGLIARSTSSRRYKTNIEPISFSDNTIKSLVPVKFQGIGDLSRGDETFFTGLIAEEVAEIPGLELLVNYNDEGQPESVNYAGLTVVLASVVSRILDRLDALEAK